MAHESISAIQFCTTPKGYLPHYSYNFRKLESLGTEVKNFPCSRLGTMLHLDILKGEEAMKTLIFQNDISGLHHDEDINDGYKRV